MTERSLRLPPLIEILIAEGHWPATDRDSVRQNTVPLASAEQIAALAPDEESLYLYPPPFRSVADDIAEHEARGWRFWTDHGAVHELDPQLALILGDFGPGSDAPILLDYRPAPEPSVIKLTWHIDGDRPPFGTTSTWVTIAESFDDFARRLGLVPR